MEDRSPKRFGLAAMALAVLAAPVVTTGALAGQQSGRAADNDMLPGKLGQQGAVHGRDATSTNNPKHNTPGTTKDTRQSPARAPQSTK